MESGVIFSTKELEFRFLGACHVLRHHENRIADIPNAKDINFELCLTVQGEITGFFRLDDRASCELLRGQVKRVFDLEGLDQSKYYKINLSGGVISSFNQEGNEFHLNFIAADVMLTHDLEEKPQKLEFECGLTNVFDLSRYIISHEVQFSRNGTEVGRIPIKSPVTAVVIPTAIGELKMNNYGQIFDKAEVMRNLKIPLITAFIETEVTTSENLCGSINRIEKIIKDFLKITSFVQSCKHDLVFIIVKQGGYPIYIKITRPRKNTPFWLPLTNFTTADLYSELWKGYSAGIEDEYNFSVTLDWYLGALATEQIETKFVYASTALECILSKFNQSSGTKNILDPSIFAKFRKCILPAVHEALETIGLKKSTVSHDTSFENISKRLNELNRYSYSEKANFMLDKLQIPYTDLGDKKLIARLITLRNAIIHAGELKDVDTDLKLEEVNNDFKRLISLICRIFLRILGYSGDYYDIFHKKVLSI